MLYRSGVKLFSIEKYPKPDLFTDLKSADDRKYICHTCHLKAMKNEEIPPELHHLRKLESVLIARRIIFQKIVILPKGQQCKIKGVVCNVPVDSGTTCETLPRPPNSTGILLLKLKRKLQYKSHQYFESVRPQALKDALLYLKRNHIYYSDIEIQM